MTSAAIIAAAMNAGASAPPGEITALWGDSKGGGTGTSAEHKLTIPFALETGDVLQIQCNSSSASSISTITVGGMSIGSGIIADNNALVDGAARLAVYHAKIAAPIAAGAEVIVTWGGTSGSRSSAVIVIKNTPATEYVSRAFQFSSLTPAGTAISHTTGVPSSDDGIFIGALFVTAGAPDTIDADPDWQLLGVQAASTSLLRIYSIKYATAAAVNFTGVSTPARVWNMSTIGYKEA